MEGNMKGESNIKMNIIDEVFYYGGYLRDLVSCSLQNNIYHAHKGTT